MTSDQYQELQKSFSAFKTANDEALRQVKSQGAITSELQVKLNLLQNQMDDLEGLLSRKSPASTGEEGRSFKSEKMKVFGQLIRGKEYPFEDLRSKGLISGEDTRGGYLTPLEYAQDMISTITEFSPLRQIATVRTTSRAGVQIPKRTGSAAAAWVSEVGSRTETGNPAFGLAEIRPHELYSMVPVSRQEVEDSAFDLESFLRSEFGEAFGVAEGVSFISGSGIGRPEGVMTNSSITSVNSGSAAAITADGLIALFYEPKTAYADQGYWIMNRSTLRAIRQLKDGSGNYLWAPGLKIDGRPATILDRPYLICSDMSDIAANAYPVAFGDFRRGYTIVDRVQFELQVDPITSKATGMIEFSARKRVGGQVTQPEAIKKLKIAA